MDIYFDIIANLLVQPGKPSRILLRKYIKSCVIAPKKLFSVRLKQLLQT